jgi:hypothetical protein
MSVKSQTSAPDIERLNARFAHHFQNRNPEMAAISLVDLPRELRALTGMTISYRKLWEKGICGEVRVTKVGSRYFGDPREVAADLKMPLLNTAG